jgi:hypothetical protein
VSEKIKELGIVPMIADQSDKDNWILSEFLDKLEQPTIPFYPLILGSKNGKIEELPNQLSPPAITPEAGKKKFINKLEELIKQ